MKLLALNLVTHLEVLLYFNKNNFSTIISDLYKFIISNALYYLSLVNHLRSIERIYGEKGAEIVDGLKK